MGSEPHPKAPSIYSPTYPHLRVVGGPGRVGGSELWSQEGPLDIKNLFVSREP